MSMIMAEPGSSSSSLRVGNRTSRAILSRLARAVRGDRVVGKLRDLNLSRNDAAPDHRPAPTRRAILCAGLAAALAPYAARAQPQTMPVVGFLSARAPAPQGNVATAFRDGLNDAGYAEGRNLAIEYRWAEGRFDRLPDLAADLVRR